MYVTGREREKVLEAALRKIADEGECSENMAGGCVGAVHSRRKRWDNPERVERVGCAKHYAAKVLADLPAPRNPQPPPESCGEA